MVRTLVAAAVIGLAAAMSLGVDAASADNLVPGGWLQPIQIPKPQPPVPPSAAAPAAHDPLPEARRPTVRSRVRERRPAAPKPAAAPADGKIRF